MNEFTVIAILWMLQLQINIVAVIGAGFLIWKFYRLLETVTRAYIDELKHAE